MTRKIFRSIVLVAGTVLLASLLLILGYLYDFFGGVQETQLKDELTLASAAVESTGGDYLAQLSSDRFRLTWIAADGSVLYDTQADASSMESHADREEVQQALKTGEGESTRYSATLLQKTLYYARRLGDGTVLRISVSRATAGLLILGVLQPMLLVLAAALILSGVLARRLSKRIVDPLNRLDLDHPLHSGSYEELAPLLGRINQQHREISSQLRTLRRKTDEFDQITGSMKEGLVLLDNAGVVLSINPAAQKLYGVSRASVGQDFLTVDRGRDMSRAIADAVKNGHSEVRSERGGREFTANVSHELKTPLQGIIGSAELIGSGMVKPEDLPRFVGHIHDEASRLVTLIDDIIRLSQLDEGGELPTEEVDLLALSRETAESLRPAAEKKHVTLEVSGESAPVMGVRRLLYEIVYNLCDNAIKYNVEGGSVRVETVCGPETVQLTVSDTGIGIAPDQQERVFERFYRVDKSHSKASGGTGLGLSIVKHAVQLHRGTIALQSEPGKGTCIRVCFPAK